MKLLLLSVGVMFSLAFAPSAFADSTNVWQSSMTPVPDSICPGPGGSQCSSNPSNYGSGCRNAHLDFTKKTATGLATAYKAHLVKKYCWFLGKIIDMNTNLSFSNEDSFTDIDGVVNSTNTWYSDWNKCFTDPQQTASLKHCAHKSYRKIKVKNTIPIYGTVQIDYLKMSLMVNGHGLVRSAGAHT